MSSGATRYAPALRLAQSLLSRSDRCRARRPSSSPTSRGPAGSGRRTSACLRARRSRRSRSRELDTAERVGVVGGHPARVVLGRGARDAHGRPDRTASAERRDQAAGAGWRSTAGSSARARSRIAPNASGSVTFDAVTVAEANMRGAIRAGSDALPKDNDFYFVLSPSRPVSVLDHPGGRRRPRSRVSISRPALDRQQGAALQDRRRSRCRALRRTMLEAARSSCSTTRRRCRPSPSSALDAIRRAGRRPARRSRRAHAGGRRLAASAGRARRPVDRIGHARRHARHSGLQPSDLRAVQGPAQRQLRQHAVLPVPALDAGAGPIACSRGSTMAGAALVERRVGSGRVLAFTSTLDREWNELPTPRRCSCRCCTRR